MVNNILVVGATGQQGRAVINALYAPKHQPMSARVLALTRSASSPRSQALKAAYPDITLVEGDTRNPTAIFAANPSISAIFLLSVPPNDEEQALPMINAAVASGSKISHIVFSSVDRGGDAASWTEPTRVPHFAAKHRIELQLRRLCEESDVQWTILRPTAFMDTYNPGFFGKMMASLWAAGMPEDRRMQLISTHDIGIFAAKALLDPRKWASRAVALAGDDLSISELQDMFRQTVDQDLPQTYGVFAKAILWWVEDARMSFEWFRTVGYGADIAELRKEEPELQDFKTWLQQSSHWSAGTDGRP